MDKKQLLTDWLKAKKAEDTATEKRHVIETQLEEIYSKEIEDGKSSKTINEDELGFKITIKKNEKWSLDQEKYKTVRLDIPEELRPEKVSYSLDLTGYNWLKENNKEVYLTISPCVSFKELKTSIKVEKK